MAMPGAIYLAIDLAKSPILAGIMRQKPLPPDVPNVIRIAAGLPLEPRTSEDLFGYKESFVRAAAIFYVREILWAADADHYRVLGTSADASIAKIAENFRCFVKWLHPDTGRTEIEPAFSARVLQAWEAIKTPERRREYDLALAREKKKRPRRRSAKGRQVAALSARRIPWIAQPVKSAPRRGGRTAVVAAITLCLAAALLLGLSIRSSNPGLNFASDASPVRIPGGPLANDPPTQ